MIKGYTMKPYNNFLVVVSLGLLVTGCMNSQGMPDNTASGALAGGAMGAIIGSTTRNPGAGAAVGALAGGAVGHSVDQAQDIQLRAQAQQTQLQETQPLSIDDIISMAKANISDDLIISQIRNSRTIYHLKTTDIIDLKRTGVSERVIDFMINSPTETRSAETASVARTAPPAPLVETMIVAPGPDYFWMSGAWIWLNDGWFWRRGYWRGESYRSGYGHSGYRHWR